MERKSQLTPEEKLSAAYHVIIMGLQVQQVASILCVNTGRVSEACTLIKDVIGMSPSSKVIEQ